MEERLLTLGDAAVVAGPAGPELVAGTDRVVLGDEPSVVWVTHELSVAGGLLPPGAVTADVVDGSGTVHRAVTGEGVWAVELPRFGGVLVRYADEHGDLVPVPVPEGVEVEPVPDADEPCPQCGAADWGKVVAAPPGRYGRDGADRPTAAICSRCGHAEGLGVLYAPLGGDADPPDQEEIAAMRAAAMAEAARFAPDPPLPRYRVTGAEAEATSEDLPRPLPELARWALEPRLLDRDAGGPPQRSPTAVLLWMNGRAREAARAACRAPLITVPVPVDGALVPFTTVTDGEAFAAAALVGETAVVVSGRGDPRALALETVR